MGIGTSMGCNAVEKAVICVLGYDRPGIVAAVSRILSDGGCNIEDVSQTSLQGEFAGIFIVSMPSGMSRGDILGLLQKELLTMRLSVMVKEMERPTAAWAPGESEPFVLTTVGPDRLGLVAGITEVLARFGVNIENLKAVFRGGENPRHNVMIYEVSIPAGADHHAFRDALQERGKELGLELSLQHRDIFEAIHRV
jgi:glycine cleavage system transcriptional repressor